MNHRIAMLFTRTTRCMYHPPILAIGTVDFFASKPCFFIHRLLYLLHTYVSLYHDASRLLRMLYSVALYHLRTPRRSPLFDSTPHRFIPILTQKFEASCLLFTLAPHNWPNHPLTPKIQFKSKCTPTTHTCRYLSSLYSLEAQSHSFPCHAVYLSYFTTCTDK